MGTTLGSRGVDLAFATTLRSNESGEKRPKAPYLLEPISAFQNALDKAKTSLANGVPTDNVLLDFRRVASPIVLSCKEQDGLFLEINKAFLSGVLAINNRDVGRIQSISESLGQSEWFVRKDIFSGDYLGRILSDETGKTAKKDNLVRWLSSLPAGEKIRAAEMLKNLKPSEDMPKDILRAAILSVAKEWVAAKSELLAKEYGRASPSEWSATDGGAKYLEGIESGAYLKYGQVDCASVYRQMYSELLKNAGGVKSFSSKTKDFSELERGDIIQLANIGKNAFPGAEHEGLGTHAFLVALVENGEITRRVDFGKKGFVYSRTSELVGQYSAYTPKGGKVSVYSVE